MLEMSASSRDPDVAALATSSDIFVQIQVQAVQCIIWDDRGMFLEGDLMVPCGGGGSIGHVKVIATCIT